MGQDGDYLLWDRTSSFHIFLPPGYFLLLPLEAAGIILLRRKQLFLKPITGKLVRGNNSTPGTLNKHTRAKMDRLGYLFLSRVEQKLPVEPLESLPPSFLLLSPPTPFAKVQLKLMKNVYF